MPAERRITIEPADWVKRLRAFRDEDGFSFFDWLAGVDESPGGLRVVVHLYDRDRGRHLLASTPLDAASPELATLTGVFAGAGWHEREAYEMFGITFTGHPGLRPLLLPAEFDGHPLRKDFVLASRAGRAWPGSVEAGESVPSARSRRRFRPPGVPGEGEWGS